MISIQRLLKPRAGLFSFVLRPLCPSLCLSRFGFLHIQTSATLPRDESHCTVTRPADTRLLASTYLDCNPLTTVNCHYFEPLHSWMRAIERIIRNSFFHGWWISQVLSMLLCLSTNSTNNAVKNTTLMKLREGFCKIFIYLLTDLFLVYQNSIINLLIYIYTL